MIANCILTSAIAFIESPSLSLWRSLQCNTFLALDDATIFLHPCLTNIRALILVACHRRDIVSPTLCYTLVSSACQMAQTLGLHLPLYLNATKKHGTQECTERLFLFWSLYALDQTLSITFGRSPVVQTSDGQLTALPDHEMLQQYAPHRNRDYPSRLQQSGGINQQRAETLSLKYEETMQTFGAFMFLREILLSKIVGRVHADLYRRGVSSASNEGTMDVAHVLCTELDLWYEKVDQTRTASMEIFAYFESNHAQHEILMGIVYLSFLYHHYTVVIHRAALHNQSRCLDSARQALSLLQEISPDTESVYNGIS